ncbi:MAG: TIGR02281 family clan AA aspartic protease [Aquabacterium sp.]|nr:TIGR02281 family clan AA aspartic protease [Aquabacterium sp.]
MRMIVVAGLLAASACAAQAQSVAMTGAMGSRALLIVDGGAPKAVAAGETHRGVRVVSVSGGEAVVDVGGQRQVLSIGSGPVAFKGAGGVGGAGSRIVLTAGSGGHFMSAGQINGRAVQFMVDTGATSVALGRPDAERLGIDLARAQPLMMSTANGVSQGWRVKLASVRVQDVELRDVEAAVTPTAMPFVLLGNSFLSRFQMKRENETLTLDRRY